MARYTPAHINPEGPGDARPTAIQIVKDEGLEGKLKGKVMVITDLTTAKNSLAEIIEPGRVELVEMDNTSFESVRAAAHCILNKANDKINILVNNAGVMAIADLQFTRDGHEMQFGTNHLAHFLLFQLLKPALLAGATEALQSRVVTLSSSAHHVQSINESDNYNFQKGDYNPWAAYAQSKIANIYMTNEIDRRYASRGLHATAVHPGLIKTPLMKHVDPATREAMTSNKELMKGEKSLEQGAATTVLAAISKEWEDKGGKYLADCEEAERGQENQGIAGSGYAKHCYDPVREARLWRDSLKIVGMEEYE